MNGTVCANSVSTAQMAHCVMQLAPGRCSNRGRQEHAERRLSLGACQRGFFQKKMEKCAEWLFSTIVKELMSTQV